MAKRTAVIDIGSNSISFVAYEKSSRFAFHLIKKARASVRIGEGAYHRGGEISPEAMDRAFLVLEDFSYIAKNLGCRKILCVATSALRDAPNRGIFINRVRRELNIGIKVIDGAKEAYLGGVAALNLLEELDEFVTVDIGGGSTEFARVQNKRVVESHSLNLGTVRLKELLFDRGASKEEIKAFIEEELSKLPKAFYSSTVVGIGGTIRALSSIIMQKECYPINALHGFCYRFKDHKKLIKSIPQMSDKELLDIDVPKNRLDTIREGISIFYRVLKRFEAKRVIASKAGVREGVYLTDLLRNTNHQFPHNFNISIRSLVDRFAINEKNCSYVSRVATSLFDKIAPHYNLPLIYRDIVKYAAKLSPISSRLSIYSKSENSFYFLLENLNFQFSHEEKLLIALLLKLTPKAKQRNREYKRYQVLLPSREIVELLYHIVAISRCVNSDRHTQRFLVESTAKGAELHLERDGYLCYECLEKLDPPFDFRIKAGVSK